MSDILFTKFTEENLHFERNLQPAKDPRSGKDIQVPQLIFNYIDKDVQVTRMNEDGKKKAARFVIQGPKMKTTASNYKHPEGKYVKKGSLTIRDGDKGTHNYSIAQTYDMENPEHVEWVRVNRAIHERLVNEWADKEVKAWSKHSVMRSTLPTVVGSLVYQKTVEDDNGNMIYEEGSKPSSFFNLFEAMTKDGKPFGTRVRILGSKTDLTKEQWLKLLTNNSVEYTPFISYQRSSMAAKNFSLKAQLDMIVIHDVTPFVPQQVSDKRMERMGVSAEDEARAKRLEAMLMSSSDNSTGSWADNSESGSGTTQDAHQNDNMTIDQW